MIQDVKANLFQTQLQACCDVTFAIGEWTTSRAAWTKCMCELIGKDTSYYGRALIPGHVHTFRVVAEVIKIQTKPSIFFGANDLAKLIDKTRLAVRRKSHHLPFIAIMRKADELRRSCIDYARGMRILNLSQHIDRIPFSPCPHGRDEITEAIDGKQRGTLERRNKEGAGKMSSMVFDIVKLRPQAILSHSEGLREIVFQIANLRRVPESILNLAEDPTPLSVSVRRRLERSHH